ncbi:hypothetical protein NT01EI_1451 [Edwardsiella ictaluri 93-146]|uniref:Uncharacterized protein n=1 Tax=Edwardsiella ictaluri (strain 93-146) TaxID=634503 RepID=C5BDT9_EDWI9|nr:hypothetical protein NT01EI_1451 [Edwardsiella ictaluri 93-146]STP88219.1 Uncharacterised protein [Edwardsiella ictaluri]
MEISALIDIYQSVAQEIFYETTPSIKAIYFYSMVLLSV